MIGEAVNSRMPLASASTVKKGELVLKVYRSIGSMHVANCRHFRGWRLGVCDYQNMWYHDYCRLLLRKYHD